MELFRAGASRCLKEQVGDRRNYKDRKRSLQPERGAGSAFFLRNAARRTVRKRALKFNLAVIPAGYTSGFA